MINIYLKDHFWLFLDRIHIMMTVPVASADKVLHTRVGIPIQDEYILTCIQVDVVQSRQYVVC